MAIDGISNKYNLYNQYQFGGLTSVGHKGQQVPFEGIQAQQPQYKPQAIEPKSLEQGIDELNKFKAEYGVDPSELFSYINEETPEAEYAPQGDGEIHPEQRSEILGKELYKWA